MQFYKVKYLRKIHEYSDVYSYFFEKGPIQYIAGQYSHILLGENPVRDYVHEMSFSSSPDEDTLRFTMHVGSSTPFKQAIENLQTGDSVSLFKIKGAFVLPQIYDKPLVFIAGGVGMTPFRSLILESKGRYNIDLFQVQRGDNFLFREELEPLVSTYYPIQPEDLVPSLEKLINAKTDALFYVCGSQRFLDGVLSQLHQSNIPESQILVEKFFKQRK